MSFRNSHIQKCLTIGVSLILLSLFSFAVQYHTGYHRVLGPYWNLIVGLALLGIGTFICASILKMIYCRHICCSKGNIQYSIGKGVFEETISQLWREFFHRTDLSVAVAIKNQNLIITGETPPSWNDNNALLAFLSERLLSSTGYNSEILIHTTPKR